MLPESTNFSPHSSDASLSDPSIDLFGLLWRRKTLIVLFTMACTLIAIAYCLVASKQYESTTQILIMKKDNNLPINSGVTSSGMVESQVAEDILATHTQIILSPHVIGRALDEFDLRALPVLVDSVSPKDTTEEHLIEQIEITRGGEGHASDAHVLNLELVHGDPDECSKILTAIVETYQTYIKEKFQDNSGEAISLIDQAREELNLELTKQESEYREFRENASLVFQGDAVINSHQTNLIEIERSISENRLRHAQVKSRLETVEIALADDRRLQISDLERMALIDAADIERLTLLVAVQRGDPISESFQALQPMREEKANAEFDRLISLRLERNERLQRVGASHPRVQQLDESIRELSRFLESRQQDANDVTENEGVDIPQLMEAYERLLRLDLDELTRRHTELLAMAETERANARKLVTDELLAESMQRKLDRTQALYDAVIDRLSEVSLIKDYGGLITEVIEPVSLGRDHWPKIPLILALGAFMGMFLGVVSAVGLELVDKAFRSPDDIEHALGLQVLTHVPDLSGLKRQIGRTKRGTLDSPISSEIVLHHAASSSEAESIRGLRTSLMLDFQGTDKKTVMVTSPDAGDGKSLLSANLAVSLAQAGNRVLLVDTDLRRPRVHELFGIQSPVGLSSVLSEQCDVMDAIESTACARLAVMPAGPLSGNPSELLCSTRFSELVSLLREKFDYVVFDCSPVLPVSDPLIIAPHINACILQMRLHRHVRADVRRARDLLRASGIGILGVCVSGAERNRSYNAGNFDQLGNGYRSYSTHSGSSHTPQRKAVETEDALRA